VQRLCSPAHWSRGGKTCNNAAMTLERMAEQIETVADRYAREYHITRDDDWYVFKLQEELGELTQKFLMLSGRARQKGFSQEELRAQFEDEIADTFSLIMLLARHFGIDIEAAVDRKWFKYLKE
jgi:NTP pyrophosphatase (non-canonical NTP hydrolase)